MPKVQDLGSGLRNNDFVSVNNKNTTYLPHIILPKDLKGTPCIEKAERRERKCKCKIGTGRWPYTWSECDNSHCSIHNPQEDSLQISNRPGTLKILPKTEPFDETVNKSVTGVLNSLKYGVEKAKKLVSRVVKHKKPPKEEDTERKIFNVSTISYIKPVVEIQTKRFSSLQTLEEKEEEINNRGINGHTLPNRQRSQPRNQNRQVRLSLRGIQRQKISRAATRSAKKSTKRGAKGKKQPKKSNKNKKQKPKNTKKKNKNKKKNKKKGKK